jgi:hypothetical protein
VAKASARVKTTAKIVSDTKMGGFEIFLIILAISKFVSDSS